VFFFLLLLSLILFLSQLTYFSSFTVFETAGNDIRLLERGRELPSQARPATT